MNRATKKILLNHFYEIFIFFYFQDFFVKIKDFKNIITFFKKIFFRKKNFLIKKNKEKIYLKINIIEFEIKKIFIELLEILQFANRS